MDAALGLTGQGNYTQARDDAKRASELDPTFFFPGWGYGWIAIESGNISDVIPELQKAKKMDSPAFVSGWLVYAYRASGDRARALLEMENLKQTSPGEKRSAVQPGNRVSQSGRSHLLSNLVGAALRRFDDEAQI